MRENKVKEAIRRAIGGMMDAIIWANPSGVGVVGQIKRFKPGDPMTTVKFPRWMKFGLGGGSIPDFVGIKTIVIKPEMVGQKIAVPFFIEAKVPGKIPTPEQSDKIALLRSFGAMVGHATNEKEALEIVTKYD